MEDEKCDCFQQKKYILIISLPPAHNLFYNWFVLEYSSSVMYQSEHEGSEASDCSRNLSDLSDIEFHDFMADFSQNMLSQLPIDLPYQFKNTFIPQNMPINYDSSQTQSKTFQLPLLHFKIRCIISIVLSKIKSKQKLLSIIKNCKQINSNKHKIIAQSLRNQQITQQEFNHRKEQYKKIESSIAKIKSIKKQINREVLMEVAGNIMMLSIFGKGIH